MNIYEIDKNIEMIINNGFSVDEETGELLFTYKDLEQLKADREQKIENVALFIKNNKALASSIKEEVKEFKARLERIEKQNERLKSYLEYATNGKPFESAKCSVSFRRSKAVEIEEFAEVPEKFLKIKTTATPDKVALRKALDGGQTFNGIRLVETKNIQIK